MKRENKMPQKNNQLQFVKIYKQAHNYGNICDGGVMANTPCFQQGALGSIPSSRIIMAEKW